MYVLVTYDVNTTSSAGRHRLRQVAKCCLNHGQRVQNSVFECLLTEAQFTKFRATLLSLIDTEHDSIRLYRLGSNYRSKIDHLGVSTSFEIEGTLII